MGRREDNGLKQNQNKKTIFLFKGFKKKEKKQFFLIKLEKR